MFTDNRLLMDSKNRDPITTEYRKQAIKELSEFFVPKARVKVESGIYDYAYQYASSKGNIEYMVFGIYESKLKDILFNCASDNPTIRKVIARANKNLVSAYNVAFLTPDELEIDKWQKLIMRMNVSQETLNNLPTIEWRPCKRCKCKEHFYYQEQTRSADEPMTTFYRCKDCNKITKT